MNRENDLSSSMDLLESSSGSGFAAEEPSGAQAPCLESDIHRSKTSAKFQRCLSRVGYRSTSRGC